ncbi:hypothetical protein Tco_0579486, partial [Tanacetum coccineum]
MNKRRKHFAKLSTKAQKRTQMSTYLKHMGNFKHSQLKSKTYKDIKRLFEIEMKRVNSFIPMDADDRTDKEQERSSKRVGDDLESDVSKKQRVDEQVETEKNDDLKEEEMKKHMEIVRDDNIAIDAIPLASKPPKVVAYNIIKACIIGHFQLIREDRSSKRNLKIQKMNIKFRGGLLGSKDFIGLLLLSTARVNLFIPMDADDRTDKEQERSSKRGGDDLESDVSKKQKVDEQVETAKNDDLKEEEMKKHMEIVRDDNIAIDAIPLASKPPTVVAYNIIKAGPEDEYERVLWGDLKVMFEPDIRSDVWRSLQGYKVLIWKLFDSCRVHY